MQIDRTGTVIAMLRIGNALFFHSGQQAGILRRCCFQRDMMKTTDAAHRWRTGEDSHIAIPYAVLGFAMSGDLLPWR